jgi:hypothetical protein
MCVTGDDQLSHFPQRDSAYYLDTAIPDYLIERALDEARSRQFRPIK